MGPGALGTVRLQCALRKEWVSNPRDGNQGCSFWCHPSPHPGPSYPCSDWKLVLKYVVLKRCLFSVCFRGGGSVCNVRVLMLQRLIHHQDGNLLEHN